MMIYQYSINKGVADFLLSFAHTDSNFDQGVRNGFVGSELHELWSHWDAEFLGHTRDLIKVWLGAES
jgi:hypothetical protein